MESEKEKRQMAEKDIAEKHLEALNDVFADILNVLLFDGEQVVKPDELEDALPHSQFKVDGKLHEQERDTAKYWRGGNIRLMLCGLENQTARDPLMPLRAFNYDGMTYKEQVIQHQRAARSEGAEKKLPVYPALTLVLYFGNTHWKEGKTLLECMDVEIPEKLRPLIQDYKINVFEIAFLMPEKIAQFTSDFRIVADYFYQTRQTKNYTPTAKVMDHVEETLKLMSVLTGDHRFEDTYNETFMKEKGASVTMSSILTEIEQRGWNEGKKEGLIGAIQAVADLLSPEEMTRRFNVSLEFVHEALNSAANSSTVGA